MGIFRRRKLPWPLTLLIGIGIVAAGCYLGSAVFNVVYHGTKVTATVIDMRGKQEKTGRHSKGTRYHAVLAFTDSRSRRIEFEDEKGFSSATQYQKGQTLPVLYLPADPVRTALVDRGWELWWTTGICGIAGVFLIGSALVRAAGYDSTF